MGQEGHIRNPVEKKATGRIKSLVLGWLGLPIVPISPAILISVFLGSWFPCSVKADPYWGAGIIGCRWNSHQIFLGLPRQNVEKLCMKSCTSLTHAEIRDEKCNNGPQKHLLFASNIFISVFNLQYVSFIKLGAYFFMLCSSPPTSLPTHYYSWARWQCKARASHEKSSPDLSLLSQVIVEKVSGSQIVDIDKRKYLVPSDITVAQFMWIIRKRIQLPSEKAIFLFVDKTVPQSR